jgi:peptide/nickel transport system substrate-binding protein
VFSRRDLLRLTAVAGGTALLNGPSFARTVFAAPASQATRADTLVVAASALPINFDGEKAVNIGNLEVIETIGDHLVTSPRVQNADGLWEYDFTQTVPELAERWDISADGTTFTFNLRSGVMSTFGNEFGAEDVRWRWERMWGLKANGLGFYSLADLKGPDSIEVVDPHTVRFHLEHPNGMFMTLLQNTFMYFIDSTEAKKHITPDDPYALSWTEKNPAIFGPYRVTQHVPGQQTVMEADPNYWRGPLATRRIIYREVPDAAVQSQLLQTGEIDLATGLDARQRLDLVGKPGVQVLDWPATAEVALCMNVTDPPFDNPLVRRAVSYAIPYDDIIQSVYMGTARRWKSPVPSVFPGYTDQYWQFDTNPDTARDLLNQAGLSSGFETTLSWDSGFPDHEGIAVLLQTALANVGITADLDKLTSSSFAERSGRRELPFLIASIFPGTPDVSFGIGKFLADPTGANFANYDNPELDQLTLDSIRTLDQTKRFQIFARMQEIVVNDAPWAFLALPGYHVAVRQNVQNVTYYPVNVLRMGEITKA